MVFQVHGARGFVLLKTRFPVSSIGVAFSFRRFQFEFLVKEYWR